MRRPWGHACKGCGKVSPFGTASEGKKHAATQIAATSSACRYTRPLPAQCCCRVMHAARCLLSLNTRLCPASDQLYCSGSVPYPACTWSASTSHAVCSSDVHTPTQPPARSGTCPLLFDDPTARPEPAILRAPSFWACSSNAVLWLLLLVAALGPLGNAGQPGHSGVAAWAGSGHIQHGQPVCKADSDELWRRGDPRSLRR